METTTNGFAMVGVISSLISALIGGAIAGWFTMRAVQRAHENDVAKQMKAELGQLSGIYQALHDEISTLWDVYTLRIGASLEALPANQPFAMYWPVSNHYFTVYEANSVFIGRIPDDELRQLIVMTYTKAKGLLDSFMMNNHMLEKLEASAQNGPHTNPQYAAGLNQSLVLYADALKEQHHDLKNLVGKLTASLMEARDGN